MISRLLSAFVCCLVALGGGEALAAAEQTVARDLAIDTSASLEGDGPDAILEPSEYDHEWLR